MPTPRKRGRASPAQSSSPPPVSTPKRLKTAAKGETTPSTSQRKVTHQQQPQDVALGSDDELDLLGGSETAAQQTEDVPMSNAAHNEDHDAHPITAAETATSDPSSTQALLRRREAVLNRLSGRVTSHQDLVGLDEQAAVLRQTLQATVQRGESNSILLVGAKGSGKSAVSNACPREVSVSLFVSISSDVL